MAAGRSDGGAVSEGQSRGLGRANSEGGWGQYLDAGRAGDEARHKNYYSIGKVLSTLEKREKAIIIQQCSDLHLAIIASCILKVRTN